MHGGHFCGFKLSVDICPRDVKEWLNVLNGLKGLGMESVLIFINGLNGLGLELAQEHSYYNKAVM